MRIRRMRLILPARMRDTAQLDAREIAKAAAHTLESTGVAKGQVHIRVEGHGRPAAFIAADVKRALRNPKPGG